jgi:metallophosphoesterase superfamily enzyme
MRSLKVSFSKKKEALSDAILPAFNGSKVTIKAPARRKENKRETELVVIVSDFHAPYHDEKLLELCQQYLQDVQPDRLIINGDLVDFPTTSRHRKTTTNKTASANECVQVGGEILAKLRASVPEDCRVQFIPGNHDGWLSTFLLNQAGPAYDLCVSGSDVPVWSLQSLFRFDELDIEMIGSEDQWGHAVVQLTDHLVVRHGDSVRAGSGASVLANMRSAEYATISGHTHRAGIVSRCLWLADGSHLVIQGAEVGGMFKMPSKPTDWPTYTQHNMDWSPGFGVVEVEEDGHYSIDLATYQNGVLMVRGERYQ